MQQNNLDTKYGRWPRRLLHVSSLTSFEWEPGNRYGGQVCPPYNSLSYTWGRFALKEDKKPDVKSLPIRFQGRRSWKIPRIDPVHFTVTEFRAAIQLAVDVDELERKNVAFLWLDVACIDQEHAKTKLAEINRQALIFQNAHTSCVWMNHATGGTLSMVMEGLSQLDDPYPYPKAVTTHRDQIKEPMGRWLDSWVLRLDNMVRMILPHSRSVNESGAPKTSATAPWFSSLWTLQESYLRPNALIFPRDCVHLLGIERGQRRIYRLRDLTWGFGSASKRLEESLALGLQSEEAVHRILKTIRAAGLREIIRGSPFSIYAASNRRQASNPCDRVYGIMQVFGFQLPLQHRGKLYTPPELEEMLSEMILRKFPVESQLFVHAEHREPGTKWRLGSSSDLPSWAGPLTAHSRAFRGARNRAHPASPLRLCKLSVTHGSAYFEGQLCSLHHLLKPFEAIDKAKLFNISSGTMDYSKVNDFEGTSSNVSVAFDMIPNGSTGSSRLQIPNVPGFVFAGVNCDPEDTHKILAVLADSDPKGDLKVLLMGSCLNPLAISYYNQDGYHNFTEAWRRENDEWCIGLILRRSLSWRSDQGFDQRFTSQPFVQCYERIGVCKWFRWDRWVEEAGDEEIYVGKQNLTDDMRDVLCGMGNKWDPAEGYWG